MNTNNEKKWMTIIGHVAKYIYRNVTTSNYCVTNLFYDLFYALGSFLL